VNASRNFKGQLLINALYLRQFFFTYFFDENELDSQDIYCTRMVVQKSNIDNFNKIFRYKTSKSLRSYSAAREQERVKHHLDTYWLFIILSGTLIYRDLARGLQRL